MGTKEKLLVLLEEKKGSYLSGEEIAESLQISRTAVWKAVKALRNSGYEIDAVQNKGYCLSERTDILSEQGIRRYLDAENDWLKFEVLATAVSTNSLAREKANSAVPEGYTILANAQTGGRGRLGRSFYSPPDTGIYMSLLLRPVGYSPAQAVKVTTMAAVAACEAIESVSGKETQIKWVNDVYMDGRKVCGILTEGAFNLENGNLDYIILGVGMNVYLPEGGFPEEISHIAGAVFNQSENDGKNRLAAAFLDCFMKYYRSGSGAYAEKYRKRSFVIGKQIEVITPSGRSRADALDVDGDCRLIVRYEDGTVEALSSAEVRIKV